MRVAIRARFKGTVGADGTALEYLNGIPARDLSDEEYDALSKEDRARVRAASVFQMRDNEPKAAKPEAAASPPKQEGGGA